MTTALRASCRWYSTDSCLLLPDVTSRTSLHHGSSAVELCLGGENVVVDNPITRRVHVDKHVCNAMCRQPLLKAGTCSVSNAIITELVPGTRVEQRPISLHVRSGHSRPGGIMTESPLVCATAWPS